MEPNIFTFNGKDITMNVCLQIRAVLDIMQEKLNIDFEEAITRFYRSKTCQALRTPESGLWAESAEYIADRYFEEEGLPG